MMELPDSVGRFLLWLSGASVLDPGPGVPSPAVRHRPAELTERLLTSGPTEPSAPIPLQEVSAVPENDVIDDTVPEEPPPQKPMQTYVLFGPATSHRTTVYLSLANDFLASRRPTFGFRLDDALHAEDVLIVGEKADVSQDMEAALAAAGCQVRRVRGSITEITAAFETLTSGPWEP